MSEPLTFSPAAWPASTDEAPVPASTPLRLARTLVRGGALLAAFVLCALDYLARAAARRGRCDLRFRAAWLHRWSRVFARIIGMRGPHTRRHPHRGLVACNHLGYLDILALASTAPCVFVSKREVAGWPVVGALARLAGTIFINRRRRTDLVRVNAAIRAALEAGVVVVIFPEGTSSDGRTVLPLKPSILEPALVLREPITPAAVGYVLWDGSVAEEVCYWGEMVFLPHLVHLLGKRHVRARVAFGPPRLVAASRKELARDLHREISAMNDSLRRL